ncbi:DUF4747 family protein [Massilia sp. LMS1-1-1.1]
MRITRDFDVSGLNIRAHRKHEASEYVLLWQQLHKAKTHIAHANTALMIGTLQYENPREPTAGIYGHLYRFLDVDPAHPWFNIKNHKKASNSEVELVNIPDELKPGLVEIPYVFDVKKHCLYFVAHEKDADLSPGMVLRLLTSLCKDSKIVERFGIVDITVVTDKAQLSEMLSWPVIRNLTLVLDRPNPTEEEDEAYFYEKMAKRGVAQEVITYKKAPEAASIVPDEEMKILARIAADNGEVKISGKNKERWSAKASSKDFPLAIKSKYNPVIQTLMDALKNVVENYKAKK